jgi:hypothetical protein
MTKAKRLPYNAARLVSDSKCAVENTIDDLRQIIKRPTNESERLLIVGRALDTLHQVDKQLTDALNGRE